MFVCACQPLFWLWERKAQTLRARSLKNIKAPNAFIYVHLALEFIYLVLAEKRCERAARENILHTLSPDDTFVYMRSRETYFVQQLYISIARRFGQLKGSSGD